MGVDGRGAAWDGKGDKGDFGRLGGVGSQLLKPNKYIWGTGFLRASVYAGRILKAPHRLTVPVLQPLELVINLTIAKALGLEMPPAPLTLECL